MKLRVFPGGRVRSCLRDRAVCHRQACSWDMAQHARDVSPAGYELASFNFMVLNVVSASKVEIKLAGD